VHDHAALPKRRGELLLELPVLLAQPADLGVDGLHQQEPVPHTIRYWVGDNRIDIARDDGARSSLWWATKNEWLGLLDVACLERGFAGEPLADDSREYVAAQPSTVGT
jgi:hypothetical protein